MAPLDDLEIACTDEEFPNVAAMTGHTELWRRERSSLALSRNGWLRVHQYKLPDGRWDSMFVPNGEGSVEWHLGWEISIPDGMFLLILPAGVADLEVPFGVIDSASTLKLSEGQGMSIAVRPTKPLTIRRGDPVARMILLDGVSLRAVSAASEEEPPSVG
jgi:hypothetical protein